LWKWFCAADEKGKRSFEKGKSSRDEKREAIKTFEIGMMKF